MTIELTHKEELIYYILFSTNCVFDINIEQYCDTKNRSKFREEIRIAIKRGGLNITEDRIIHKDNIVIWKIEINKLCNG